jgi:hypothetical protein
MFKQIDDAEGWLPIVRAEYAEFPGMQLTRPQIRRLFNLDAETCDAVVDALEAERFLRKARGEVYVRAD